MKVKIDKNKLEKLLITHWSEFLNILDLRNFCADVAKTHYNMNDHCKTRQISISRFEPTNTPKGFVIWIESTISQPNKEVNITIECFFEIPGNLIYRNSTLNNI
jgi:hypothetical protein